MPARLARALPLALTLALSSALPACSDADGGGGASTTSATTTSSTSSSTSTTTTATSTATLGTVTADALHTELAAKDFLLINVHTPHTEDIPGTDAALAYTDVDAIVAFVGKDLAKKVVVYCAGTSMSKPVGTELAARGYTDVRYLLGGYMGWKSAGYPLTP